MSTFKKFQNILSEQGGTHYKAESGHHYVLVRPSTLLDWIEFIKEDLGFLTLVDISGRRSGHEFEMIYQFLNMGSHQRLFVQMFMSEKETIPSIRSYFANADWIEREQAERFVLKFSEKLEPLLTPEKSAPVIPELRYNPNKSEAPYPEEKYFWKKYDLMSPMTKGHFEWMVCFDPMKVVESKLRIGFHHTGLEEVMENKDIFQILQLADKLNVSSSPSYSVVWAKIIEERFNISIPERAKALRIILLELARVADHLTVLASICYESQQSEYLYLIDARDKVYELFEKFAGHRQCSGLIKFGGLKLDLPPGWIVEYQNAAEVLTENLRLIHNTLTTRQAFRDMLQGDSLDAQSVLQLGVNGPAMRAAGLNFDLRKSQPFYFYQDIDFDIPVGIHGTTYDRYLIRTEEIFQSLRIITQVIDNLPLGDFINPEYDKNYLELATLFKSLDSVSNYSYGSVESPSGEAGFLVKLDSELKPERLKIKTPGFTIAQAIPELTKGLREDQLKTCLASFGLSRWEMDR